MKIYDVTGLDEIPPDFYERGLEKAHVIYMRELWPPGGEPNWLWADWDYLREVIESYADRECVWLDIEGNKDHDQLKYWDFNSDDPAIRDGAIWRYKWVLYMWQWYAPNTGLVLYGFPKASVWGIVKDRPPHIEIDRAIILREITDQPNVVGLWPGAYYRLDRPEHFKRMIERMDHIARNVYHKPCYFSISQQDVSSGTRPFQFHEQATFKYQLDTLTECGVDIAIWSGSSLREPVYNQELLNWRWMGGSEGTYTNSECYWLETLDRYLQVLN